jgi:4-hydroxy-L-threonine phosphate dehydrogenase PdxA
MSVLKFVAPAVVLAAGVMFSSSTSYAKKEYMVATKKACKYCHVNAMATDPVKQKELTDAGKYYKEHKSFDGYVEK